MLRSSHDRFNPRHPGSQPGLSSGSLPEKANHESKACVTCQVTTRVTKINDPKHPLSMRSLHAGYRIPSVLYCPTHSSTVSTAVASATVASTTAASAVRNAWTSNFSSFVRPLSSVLPLVLCRPSSIAQIIRSSSFREYLLLKNTHHLTDSHVAETKFPLVPTLSQDGRGQASVLKHAFFACRMPVRANSSLCLNA